jgi:hypothetical protein
MTGRPHRRSTRGDRFDQMRACSDTIVAAVTAATKRRPELTLPEWIEHERSAVLAAANLWAATHPDCGPVTASDIERCEQIALGHTYSSKLALYVTELVYRDAGRCQHIRGHQPACVAQGQA